MFWTQVAFRFWAQNYESKLWIKQSEIFSSFQVERESVTRLCFQYSPIFSNGIYPIHTNCAKVRWKPNKPQIYCQRILNICQRGGNSPNLVTLYVIDKAACFFFNWEDGLTKSNYLQKKHPRWREEEEEEKDVVFDLAE